MKKLMILLAISAALCGMAAYGQETVSIQTTDYGQLGELLGDRITTVQYLTVAGPIDKSDFDVMKKAIREGVLSEIDLKDAQCRDNEIPNDAFLLYWSVPNEATGILHEKENAGESDDERNNLRRIILPSGIERIGWYAFADTHIEEIDLPETVSSMGMCCFAGSHLRSITVGSQIMGIPDYAFQQCPYLREVYLHAPVGFLDSHSFSMLNLAKIELPSTFFAECFAFCQTFIEEVIFNSKEVKDVDVKNIKLKKVVFNEGVEMIAERMFSGCPALSVIIFPSTLQSVGEGCFADNPALQKVYCRSVVPPTAEADTFCGADGIAPSQAVLYVPVGSANAYRGSTGWKCFTNIVEIEDSQFPSGVDCIMTDTESTYMYDLQGRQVNPETADPGIYIRNGKKILIR